VLGKTSPIRRHGSSSNQFFRTWGRQSQVETSNTRREFRRASPERRDRDVSRGRWDSARYQGSYRGHEGRGRESGRRAYGGDPGADGVRRGSVRSRGVSPLKRRSRRADEGELAQAKTGRENDQGSSKLRGKAGVTTGKKGRRELESVPKKGESGRCRVQDQSTVDQCPQAGASGGGLQGEAVTDLVLSAPGLSGLAWPSLGELGLLPEEAGFGQSGGQSSGNSMGLDLFDESWLMFGEPWDG
jgi:hypothetical protein